MIPAILPYPGIRDLETPDALNGIYCYIHRLPKLDGFTILIKRHEEEWSFTIGEWNGDYITPGHTKWIGASTFVQNSGGTLAKVMRIAGVKQALFYIGSGLELIDVRVSLNKWLGPGMVDGMFGKIVATPKLITINSLTPEILEEIWAGSGLYSGDLLIRPSRARTDDRYPDHRLLSAKLTR